MDSKDAEYRQLFLTEALENFEKLNNLFIELEQDPSNKSAIDHIFRIVHTLKGNAMLMGIDSIADLLKEGYAADVVELSEYALQGVEKSLNAMDDSDGYMGGILDRLQNLHHEACTQSQPDQEDLAKRLFEWELRAEWDTFHGAAGIYADVLGEKVLAVYRTFAEKVWEQIPQLNPGDSDRFTDSQRFLIPFQGDIIVTAGIVDTAYLIVGSRQTLLVRQRLTGFLGHVQIDLVRAPL